MDYQLLKDQVIALLQDERDMLANMANFAALIYHELEDINWAGFYLYKENELVLGPFQGKVACVRIELGKGVCGTSAQKRESVRVKDVHQFPGHIACDSASNSELVIPVIYDNNLVGVFDLDSPRIDRFTESDKEALEELISLFIRYSEIKNF